MRKQSRQSPPNLMKLTGYGQWWRPRWRYRQKALGPEYRIGRHRVVIVAKLSPPQATYFQEYTEISCQL